MTRTIKLLGLSITAALLVGAYAAASASATEFYFDNGVTVSETEPLEGGLETGTEAVFEAKAFGVTVRTGVQEAVVTGSVDNLAAAETQGHGTNIQIHFTKGVVTSPANCTVHDPVSINPGAVNGTNTTTTLTALAEAGKVSFKPEAGTVFIHLEFTGASCPLAGQNLTVEGSIVGIVNNAGCKLAFTKSSGSTLTFGGQPASMVATFKLKSTGTCLEVK